jgi:hypothetical protein
LLPMVEQLVAAVRVAPVVRVVPAVLAHLV